MPRAFAAGDAATLGARLLAQLPRDRGATLGILYVSEPAAAVLPALVDELAAGTGIAHWTGGVGLGVCGAGEEVYDRPAAAVLTAAVPARRFPHLRARPATPPPTCRATTAHGSRRRSRSSRWSMPTRAAPTSLRATIDAGAATGAFLVGGLVSHRTGATLVARTATSNELGTGGGMAGLMLAPGRRRGDRRLPRAACRSARCAVSTRRATMS